MPTPENVTAPILVVGPGRSGTSWLMHALDEHPDVRDVIENRVVEGLYLELFENWWARDWKWVCDEGEAQRRAVEATRRTLCTLFPTDQPRWVMKMIWRGRPWKFVRAVFPDAHYIHITRSPTTNIPSMMDYMGRHNPSWKNVRHAEHEWVQAHREALALEDKGVPYIRIKQEDAAADPAGVWDRLRGFLGLRDVPVGNLENEINAGEATKGQVRFGRPEKPWGDFTRKTHAMAVRLGYLPESEGDEGLESAVVEGLTAQLAEANAERERMAEEIKRLREGSPDVVTRPSSSPGASVHREP